MQFVQGSSKLANIKAALYLGLLIFVFYFTSKNLLYYQHLLVNTEQHSKKDLVCEQVEIVYMPACVQPIVLMQKIDFSLPCKITSLIFTQETL